MVYYKVKCSFRIADGADEAMLMRFWSRADREYVGGSAYKLFILNRGETSLDAVLMFSVKDYTFSEIKKKVMTEFDETGDTIEGFCFLKTYQEITASEAISLLRTRTIEGIGGKAHRCSKRALMRYCDAGYMNDETDLKFDEFALPHTQLSLSKAKDKARGILADSSFFEELERIYSPLNKHKFFGSPVNYKINAASRETAKNLVKLLAKALYSNKRLLSSRVTYITELCEDSYDSALTDLCENSYASVVAIECTDSDKTEDRFARGRERQRELLYETLKKHSSQTVFVLLDLGSKACKQTVDELISKEDMSFIEIFEGSGDKDAGTQYLNSLLKENKVRYANEDFILPDQEEYSVSDIVHAYKKMKKNSIRNSIYRAYKEIKPIKTDVPKSLSNGYDQLQSMVGLTEIKSLIDQIISAQKMNKARRDMGLDTVCSSKHMIFTGNPGSAKTTVARLLASILYDEHVLDNNKFIECGRQDLVGKYVGWTAKQVEAQFMKARGGVLFIDEAYSLVEQGGYYGDEAINTIVQMMENYRNEVIVIFAGYPDKMERFLEKNEGLRSRIAFHVDFPDYNAEELCDILKLMSKEKGYMLDEEAEKKCRGIFEIACQNEEFGNGRFVRNVLEQAIIKQSSRIVSELQNETFDKTVISTLSATDFDINAAKTYKPTKTAIGF